MGAARTIRAGTLDVEYDLADYTAPWRCDEPETIVLHHGYCRSMAFWQSWVPLLSGHFRVLRISGRGCGGTTVPPAGAPYSMDVLVADTIAVLDALSIARAVWVGESSGGILGLATALQHPRRISALAMCDTPYRIASKVADAYNLGEPDYATTIRKHGFRSWCRQTLPYRIDMSRASAELQDWYVEQMGSAPEHIAVAHHLMAVDADLWPRLPEIRVPLLWMAGAASKLASPEGMQAMHAALPSAKLVRFEGYGHGINLLAPEQCVAELRRFLDERRGDS